MADQSSSAGGTQLPQEDGRVGPDLPKGFRRALQVAYLEGGGLALPLLMPRLERALAPLVAALEEQLKVEHMELEARDVRIGELTDEVERLRGAYKVEKTRRSEAQQERGNAQCAVCVAEAEVARLTARVGEADSKLVSLQADHARVVSELSGAKRERDRHRDEADEYYALFCRTLALPFETKSLERAAAAMAALAADQAVIDVARAESARQERDRLLGLVRAQRPRCPREAAWATAVLSEEGASSDGD